MSSQKGEHHSRMLLMIILYHALHQDVIKQNHGILTEALLEDVVHQNLECGWGILQAKWHNEEHSDSHGFENSSHPHHCHACVLSVSLLQVHKCEDT